MPPVPIWQAPGTPKDWHLENIFAGSTGHVFVAASCFGFTMYGTSGGAADLDELDSKGAYLGTRSITDVGGGGLDARTSVFGPRYHAFAISIPHSMGIRYDRLEGDAVSLQWQKGNWDEYAYLGLVTGNADGDLFASFTGATFGAPLTTWSFPWGVEDGNLVVKWNSAGGHVYTKNVAPSPSVVTAGNSGDAFLAGAFTPGADLGCGPLAGAGGDYVARLDPIGQCLWSHAISGTLNAGGSLAILASAADGSAIVADSHFSGTTDLGCGPMTAAPGGSSFVARLDAAGACLWSKSFDVHDVIPSLFPSGDLLVSMPFTGTIDLGGGPLTSAGAQDVAVARLDGSSGAQVWSKSFGTAGVSLCPGPALRCNAVADANGSVVLSGALTGWVDFGGGPLGSMAAQTYAVKLDGNGSFLWHHAWPDHTFVAVDPCGAVLGASDVGAYITVDKLAP